MRLRSEGLATRTLGEEMVILDLDSSRYLSVSGVGLDIVELLGVEQDENALVAELLDRYDVAEDLLRRDTAAFLEELKLAGLLEA